MDNVKVLGVWGSPLSTRIEIALKFKGVSYEFAQQDMLNKSVELLKYNPIHGKIPVLLHNGKPIIESLVILEYIDEIWKDYPLLPFDPYERAHARFWASFIDDKILPSAAKALLSQREGEDKETKKARNELSESLTILENEIAQTELFKGNMFMKLIALFIVHWIPFLEEFAGVVVLTREKFPGIFDWADEIFSCTIVNENLPDKGKMLAMLRSRSAHA